MLTVAVGLGGLATDRTAKKYGLPAPVWSSMTTVVVVLTLAALTHTGV